MVKEISQNEFEELVVNASGPVVLDFYSTECPPCEALAPKFEYFAKLYGEEVNFYKIFRQGNKELAQKLKVMSSPTLLFFSNGQEVAKRLSGAIRKAEFKETLLEAFDLPDKAAHAKREELDYDIVIIGGGPAGLTSATYAARAKLKTLVIDKGNPGGYVNITHSIANYPGTGKDIQGFMLGHYMTEQARLNGADILMAVDITHVNLSNKIIEIDDDKRIKAKAIIIATGSKPRPLNIPGETELAGKGISYCATCDGAFYEGKKVYVIGGGNSAVEESIYLTKFAEKVTIIHQFDEFQANKASALEALANPKIEVMWSHEPRAFIGDTVFEKLEVENVKTGERKVLDEAEGIFVFIGYVPQTDIFVEELEKDKYGCISTNELMETNIKGVYAAGDVRSKKYRQVTTAVSDGTIAALEAAEFIKKSSR